MDTRETADHPPHGTVLGPIFGGITHVAPGGERDFAPAPAVAADRFEVMVDAIVADWAAELARARADAIRRARA